MNRDAVEIGVGAVALILIAGLSLRPRLANKLLGAVSVWFLLAALLGIVLSLEMIFRNTISTVVCGIGALLFFIACERQRQQKRD
ncbi:MAG TPA: hypothetical protein VGM25_15695 [Caulobacteraceae bacterium]